MAKVNDEGRKRGGAPRRRGMAFFRRDAVTVARALIGTILVRRMEGVGGAGGMGGREYRVRIVETEAYVGPHDLASHASKGRTARTEVMFGPGGHAYVYFIYGMYEMLNVVVGKVGDAQAVLIRAAEPVSGWEGEGEKMPDLSGPGRLTRALGITRVLNGVDLTGDVMHFEKRVGRVRIEATARIGVDYAKEWKDELLRFVDAKSGAVSGRRMRKRAK